ncbi:MAG: hypothetical protein K8R23_08200 [Chthoniobacter sp.]|nr:hypothetical protein [Chthoniobacter sp.]
MTIKSSATKNLAIGLSALAVAATTASATLTMDLRASGVTGTGVLTNSKNVTMEAAGGTITFQVWAQVTGAAGMTGIQSVSGSIMSSSLAPAASATGAMSTSTATSPFNNGNVAGVTAELTADTVGDVGSTSTSLLTNYIKYRKDPNGGGEQIGGAGTFYSTGTAPGGATINTIAGGFEFLMGTATLTLSAFNATALNMNWVKPVVTSVANRGTMAVWVDGGVAKNGNTNFAEYLVNSTAVTITAAVPEPSAFGMVLVGALGLVGFRRMGFRRIA